MATGDVSSLHFCAFPVRLLKTQQVSILIRCQNYNCLPLALSDLQIFRSTMNNRVRSCCGSSSLVIIIIIYYYYYYYCRCASICKDEQGRIRALPPRPAPLPTFPLFFLKALPSPRVSHCWEVCARLLFGRTRPAVLIVFTLTDALLRFGWLHVCRRWLQ